MAKVSVSREFSAGVFSTCMHTYIVVAATVVVVVVNKSEGFLEGP